MLQELKKWKPETLVPVAMNYNSGYVVLHNYITGIQYLGTCLCVNHACRFGNKRKKQLKKCATMKLPGYKFWVPNPLLSINFIRNNFIA